MKRFSLFFALFLIISSNNRLLSQAGNFAISPAIQCYNPIGVYNMTAAVTATVGGAASYSWAIAAINPTNACPPTTVALSPSNGTAIAITTSCCGIYQVFLNPYSALGVFIPAGQVSQTFQVICAQGGSITVAGTNTNNAMCIGNSATLTGNGAVTYTWLSSTSPTTTGASIIVTPTSNTTYTMLGTTAQGCTISANATINVQSATFSVSPVSTTLCPNAPVVFSSTSAVQTNSALYTPGTLTTGVVWFNPGSASVAATQNHSTTATGGVWTAIMTHTGAAGSCSLTRTSNVTTISTIPITLASNPASGSVCPGANISLTATSIQTVVNQYTWTAPTPTLLGRNITRPVFTNPTNFTVNVTYFGCTGTATFAAYHATLTPTLSANSASSCPGRSITLTASGGITYTFSGQAAPSPSFALGNLTSNTASHAPTATQLTAPIIYTVRTTSLGCTGSATFALGLLVMTPSVVPSTGFSVCPNRSLCLIPQNGAGTTYTYQSFNFSPTSSVVSTSSVCFNPGTSFPHTYIIDTDSAGCKGQTSIVIDQLTLNPTITPSSFSICPGRTISLTSSGGAGTSYTFTSPYATTNPTAFIIPKASPTVNTVQNFTTPSTPPLPYTYTVVVDSVGCVGTNTVTIGLLTITPTLSASSASICQGSSFTLTSTGGAGTNYTFTAPPPVNNFSTGLSSSGTSFSVSHNAPSIASSGNVYTVTVDSLGCVGTQTLLLGSLGLTQNLTLTATGVNNGSVCPNGNFTLTANSGNSGSTYTFVQLPTNTISVGSASTIASTSLFPMVFQVYSDSAGCTGSKTITINRMFLNNVSITASPTLVCANNPATLTVNGVGTQSSSATSYSYGLVNGSTITPITIGPSNTLVVNPSTVSVYVVHADSAGCISPTTLPISPFQSVTVSIRPGLTFTPSATSMSVCAGLPTTLSLASASNNVSYTWTPPSSSLVVSSGQGTSAVANPTATTTYSIFGQDPLGCIGNTLITIGIDPNASLSVVVSASSPTICAGLVSTLTASCSISNITYSWSPNAGLTPPVNASSVVASPSVTTVYNVLVNNGFNCFGTANYTLNVSTYPNLTAVRNPSIICQGFASTITASGATSYTWIGANSTFSGSIAQQSISVPSQTLLPGSPPALATYSLIGSNGGGCTTQIVTSILTRTSIPIIVSSSSGTTCIEENTFKTSKPVLLNASGYNNYTWFPFNPLYMTYSLGVSTTVRPPANTTYTVFGLSSVCSGSGVVTVSVIPQFTMNVVPPLPAMCFGDSLKLSITNIATGGPNGAVGPASAFSYSWTDPNPISINPSAGLSPTVFVFPQSTTTYSADLKDSRGCASEPRLVTVTVLPRPLNSIAIPTINSVPTNTICYVGNRPGPLDVILDLTGINKNTNLPFGVMPSYTWIAPNPKYNSIMTDPFQSSIKISAPVRVPSLVTYTLRSGYNGIAGCQDIDTVSIRIIDCRSVGNFTFTTSEKLDTICARTCITFINQADTASGGPQTYTWTFPGGSPNISYEKNPTVCYNLPNKYNVFLKVRNPYPLTSSTGQVGSEGIKGVDGYIKVVDVPNVTIFSPGQLHSDTTIRFGQEINMTGSGAFRYVWSPDYNISSLTNPKVVVNPFRSTQYILTGYNSAGCFSSDTLNVIVIEDCGEMYVPNAFTPNDDKANDVLYVRGICLESLSFMIFNRWGEKVFETVDQKIGWDGTYKGEAVNSGIYVYRLEGKTQDGKPFSHKGNITLIR